jgi:hypothetical protein
MITSDAHEQRDLPPENWAQRLVSSVAYQCPEIVAGLLLMVIGWVWWWPAGWLGAASVAYALVAATVRHIHEHQLAGPLSPDWPATDQDITADQDISDRNVVDQNGETE